MKRKLSVLLMTLILAVAYSFTFMPEDVKAASKISISDIDYDDLTMKVNLNENTIVYFSTDGKKTWNELEGNTVDGLYKVMDISWASPAADVTLYLKGDKNQEVTDVEIPKQNLNFKVRYNKASGEFGFSGNEDCTSFMWRKTTDYNWTVVEFNESSASYQNFLKEMDKLKFKGSKVVFKTGQVKGKNGDDMGERPSKEIIIAIPKRAAAPSIKVNVKKMTLNTKDTMEYYNNKTGEWSDCEKNMLVSDVAAEAMYSAGTPAKNVTLKIRVAETEKKPYSLSTMLVIPAQTASPVKGTDYKVSIVDKKLNLEILKATKENPIEYCVIKPEDDFDEAKAKWKTVKAAKIVALSEKSAGTGSTIYIRFAGVAANVSKNISLKLPSTYCFEDVTWPVTPTPTPAAN